MLSLSVKFSIQWRGPYYPVCAYADGKLKQCTLSLEDLQSKTYTHCQIISRLCRASFAVPLENGSQISTITTSQDAVTP